MIHLRRFNEKLSDDFISELKEFCETHLAYLLDKDFSIGYRVLNNSGRNDIIWRRKNLEPSIEIVIRSTKERDIFGVMRDLIPFSWEEVSNHIIPFIHFLNIKYCITQKTSYYGTGIVCIETPTPDKIKKTTFDVEKYNNLHNLSLSDIKNDNIQPDTKIKYIEITIAGYRYIPKQI
jgi:hypothetical protein